MDDLDPNTEAGQNQPQPSTFPMPLDYDLFCDELPVPALNPEQKMVAQQLGWDLQPGLSFWGLQQDMSAEDPNAWNSQQTMSVAQAPSAGNQAMLPAQAQGLNTYQFSAQSTGPPQGPLQDPLQWPGMVDTNVPFYTDPPDLLGGFIQPNNSMAWMPGFFGQQPLPSEYDLGQAQQPPAVVQPVPEISQDAAYIIPSTEFPVTNNDTTLPDSGDITQDKSLEAIESVTPPSDPEAPFSGGLETLRPAFRHMFRITTLDEARDIVTQTLREKRAIVTSSPDLNAKKSVIVSGNVYVAELEGQRWMDRGSWTGSRKGGKTGGMIYRQLAPGKARGTTFSQDISINEANCVQILGVSASDIFQYTGMQVLPFAKTYIGGVHGNDICNPKGMVKRTFKVVLDASSEFVPEGSKREFMVISYYTLSDLARHFGGFGKV